jgi:hypothetical protein
LLVGGVDGLELLRRDFRRRRLSLSGITILLGVLAIILLSRPGSPDTFTWPWALAWTTPLLLVLMIALALQWDSRKLQFVAALESRISTSRYFARDLGVVLVFDNNLVLQRSVDLRFHLFLNESGEVLEPTPEKVYSWLYHSTRMRGMASPRGGEGSIPIDLQRIRDAIGARDARLILSERPKPLEGWPEVRYSNSLWLTMPVGSQPAEVILSQIDDVARFLSDSGQIMIQAPWPPPRAQRGRG